MMMQEKLFPFDKNYILKEAQAELKERLLREMVEKARTFYFLQYNSLGLIDDTIRELQETEEFDLSQFDLFYEMLAGIYRYKYSSNQLELLFDGGEHFLKYSEDWKASFETWVNKFCLHKNFLLAVLELAIFYPNRGKVHFKSRRLQNFLTDYFQMKWYKRKGLLPLKVA